MAKRLTKTRMHTFVVALLGITSIGLFNNCTKISSNGEPVSLQENHRNGNSSSDSGSYEGGTYTPPPGYSLDELYDPEARLGPNGVDVVGRVEIDGGGTWVLRWGNLMNGAPALLKGLPGKPLEDFYIDAANSDGADVINDVDEDGFSLQIFNEYVLVSTPEGPTGSDDESIYAAYGAPFKYRPSRRSDHFGIEMNARQSYGVIEAVGIGALARDQQEALSTFPGALSTIEGYAEWLARLQLHGEVIDGTLVDGARVVITMGTEQ